MNPQETRQASDLIFRIRDSGLSVVVIEHDMRFIFNLCDRVLCLVRGEALIEGTPGEVQSDPRVIEAYIGTGEDDDEDVDAPTRTSRTPPSPRRRATHDRDARGQGPGSCLRQDRGGQEDQLLASSRARSSR